MANVIVETVLRCPACGDARPATMPTDACQWFYRCQSCLRVLPPLPGDCCVFCSYAEHP